MHLKDEELVNGLSNSLGEELLAATYARVPTALRVARFFSPIGNYLIARPSARSAARKITEETSVPLDGAMAVGITASALHLWSADPMLDQVSDHLGEVPLASIKDIEVGAGRSWQPMTISLSGGEDIKLEGRGSAHMIEGVFKQYRQN